jgi:hypothetical protein
MAVAWTYRKKNKALLAAGVILLLLAYLLSIKRTIAVYREVSALASESELAANAPAKAAALEKQLREIDDLLGTQHRTDDIQQSLLGTITEYCKEHNTVLREFPKTVYHEEKDLAVETNVFTVEGSFARLLRLVYLLEQESRSGRISSAKFFMKKDPKTHTSALNVTIYLQNLKKTGNEQ